MKRVLFSLAASIMVLLSACNTATPPLPSAVEGEVIYRADVQYVDLGTGKVLTLSEVPINVMKKFVAYDPLMQSELKRRQQLQDNLQPQQTAVTSVVCRNALDVVPSGVLRRDLAAKISSFCTAANSYVSGIAWDLRASRGYTSIIKGAGGTGNYNSGSTPAYDGLTKNIKVVSGGLSKVSRVKYTLNGYISPGEVEYFYKGVPFTKAVKYYPSAKTYTAP